MKCQLCKLLLKKFVLFLDFNNLLIFSNSDSGVTGQKRPSDNAAENNGPTAKKANVANLEVVKDEPGEKVVEEYPIPDQLVGLVIGRGGENIQRIQAETNVSR